MNTILCGEKCGQTVMQPGPACVAAPSLDSTVAAVDCCCKFQIKGKLPMEPRTPQRLGYSYNLSASKFVGVAFAFKVGGDRHKKRTRSLVESNTDTCKDTMTLGQTPAKSLTKAKERASQIRQAQMLPSVLHIPDQCYD